ncbi:MAG TPA: preprotein translocase subunit SecG [Pyrinomonadaceae bacterium]
MLTYILYALFILSCVVLIIFVLLQPGKSDAGALFSSSVSSTAFGPRGTASVLAKITIGAAAAFMLIALMLSLPAVTGSHSVLQSTGSESVPTPTPQPSPAASVAPVAPVSGPASSTTASPEASKATSSPAEKPKASPTKK